jgi:hypothetical protein
MTIGLQKPTSLPQIPQDVQIEEPQEQNDYPTVDEALENHENRIRDIEAALLRIRGAI